MEIILNTPPPDEDTVAAVLAAVSCMLDAEAVEAAVRLSEPGRAAWRATALLEAQGLPAARVAGNAGWGTASRAQRARRWSKGIVGS